MRIVGPRDESWSVPKLDKNGAYTYVAWGDDGLCLYVGATCRLFMRLAQHADASLWWEEAVYIQFIPADSRADAFSREAELIRELSPRDNVVGGWSAKRISRALTPHEIAGNDRAIESMREIFRRRVAP